MPDTDRCIACLDHERREGEYRTCPDCPVRARPTVKLVHDGFSRPTIRLAHLADDYERTRTRSLRTITQQVRLLTDAEVALRNGDTEVVAEFLERAVTALVAERDRLRAETPAKRA